jgi:hypothetical protein
VDGRDKPSHEGTYPKMGALSLVQRLLAHSSRAPKASSATGRLEALAHTAVLHRSDMLSDEAVGMLVDEATRLVVGYLQ